MQLQIKERDYIRPRLNVISASESENVRTVIQHYEGSEENRENTEVHEDTLTGIIYCNCNSQCGNPRCIMNLV